MVNQFNIENCKDLANVYLHDAEIDFVLIQYKEQIVQVKLRTAIHEEILSRQLTMRFSSVHDIHIPIKEPWGEGFYINTVYAERDNDSAFRTCLELNSGDVLVIVA
ncbi:hypothetical protein [Paenibacillus periandrae]|uniref:hypothetical protein n=1 Tax=Paenibacillus periandrae TaxID=1761741 RepID=UPI001F091B8D|nr:hypothetical protein [Paenibacillus periandrae]